MEATLQQPLLAESPRPITEGEARRAPVIGSSLQFERPALAAGPRRQNSENNRLNSPYGPMTAVPIVEAEAPSLTRKPVGMNLSPSQMEDFRRAYGIDPIISTSKRMHRHPHLAYERSTLETRAVNEAQAALNVYKLTSQRKSILVDIGSAPSRVLHQSPDVHCLVPILHKGDADRSSYFAGNPRVCAHKLYDHLDPLISCPCHEPVFAYIAIHSVYYLTIDEIVAALSKSLGNAMYIVTHDFKGASGGFYQEAEWHRIAPTTIQMEVKGNRQWYTHEVPPWQHNGEVNLGGGWVLEATHIDSLGVTDLTRLSLVQRPPQPPVTGNWQNILSAKNYTGPIHVPPSVLGVVQSEVTTLGLSVGWENLYGDGDFLYATGVSDRFVVLPRGAVAEVAVHIALLPRDPALLRQAKHKARYIIDVAPIPVEQKPLAITLVVALALCVNVVNETAIMNTAVTQFSGWWRAHARVTSLMRLPTWSYWHMVVFFMLCLAGFVGALALYPEDPTPHHLAVVVVICAILVVTIIACLGRCFYERIHASSGGAWSDARRYENTAVDVTVPVYPIRNNYVGSLAIAPRATDNEEGVDLEIAVDPRPLSADPPTRLIHSGIAPSNYSVNVMEPTQAAELSGMSNRMMQPRFVPERNVLAEYNDVFINAPEFKRLDLIEVVDDDPLFEKWVAKYSVSRRAELAEARSVARGAGRITASKKGRTFGKLEKGNKIDQNGEATTKMRMIVSFDDQITACGSPFVVEYSNQLGELWNMKPSRLLYARSMLAEEIGDRISEFAQKHGGFQNIAFLVSDYKGFDGTTEYETLKPPNALLMSKATEPTTRDALALRKTNVKSAHGVKLKGKVQINSGKPTTNLEGTEVNAAVAIVWMNQEPNGDYLALLMGDDNTTIVDAAHVNEARVEDFSRTATKLGLKPEAKLVRHLWDAEFCSKLFYPVGERLIIGCKPGRVIRRLGYNLTTAGAANLRGAAISLIQCCNFIPFLQPYLKRILELTTGSKAVRDKRAEEWTFHTATLHEASEETYIFMYNRYGLTRSDEKDWINQLSQITKLPVVLSNRSVDMMIERDEQ